MFFGSDKTSQVLFRDEKGIERFVLVGRLQQGYGLNCSTNFRDNEV